PVPRAGPDGAALRDDRGLRRGPGAAQRKGVPCALVPAEAGRRHHVHDRRRPADDVRPRPGLDRLRLRAWGVPGPGWEARAGRHAPRPSLAGPPSRPPSGARRTLTRLAARAMGAHGWARVGTR